jgi:hypothetical protein
MRRRFLALILPALCGLALVGSGAGATSEASGDELTLELMEQANDRLRALGLGIRVEEIEFFTIGEGRPANRLHQQDNRFVPGDPRRLDGSRVAYLVDESDGATSSGLTAAQTGAAIDRAMATWDAEKCLRKVGLVERADGGVDPDITDALFGFGGFGEPLLADVVHGGWLPRGFFEAIAGPSGGRGILGATFTYVFTDDADVPTDIDGDNYGDTALREIFFNDTFGKAGTDRAGNPWRIDGALPAIDVESVALHESGHALGLAHFGSAPVTVMNPRYAGPLTELQPADHAGMCSVYGSWR